MKVITSDMFYSLKQEAKEDIINWWNPEELDLIETNERKTTFICLKMPRNTYSYNKTEGYEDIDVINSKNDIIEKDNRYAFTPLLTVNQLINFIEWKTGLTCDYSKSIGKEEIIIEVWNNITCEKNKYTIKRADGNLLLALWDCVLEIYK